MHLKYLDTCYPDYFQGFGGEVLAVPINGKMRNGEVLEALQDEINAWSGYLPDGQATEQDFEDLHNSANELFEDCDKRKTFCRNAGEDTYAYFGIVTEE
jgi:hypothetical protein